MKKNAQRLRSGEFSNVRESHGETTLIFSTFHADHPRNLPQSKKNEILTGHYFQSILVYTTTA